MPRYPEVSPTLAEVGSSVYSRLADRVRTFDGEVYPFHVGDTWMEPPDGCRMQDLRVEDHPGMHRYASPMGMPKLLEAVAARVEERTGVPTSEREVLITAGATGGLGAALGALMAPGEEVLILAPHWPLVPGIVRSLHGTPIQVPFLGVVETPEEAVEVVSRAVTERTVAVYLNTPNNPTGRLIPRDQLEALVAWARREGLWILSDEVYEDYSYRGRHVYTRSLASERTLSFHSFSKAYGMAGNRCGYVVAGADMVQAMTKVATHTFYSTPTAAQLAALAALGPEGDLWLRDRSIHYSAIGEAAAEHLGEQPPEGGTFLFLDLADYLDETGESLDQFLERCADQGLLLAPGPSFGPYPTHIRLCFTAAHPAVTARGVEKLAEILGREESAVDAEGAL